MSSAVAVNDRRWVAFASAVGRMGILAILLFTSLSFLGRYSFGAEICTHFVNLYAVAGVGGAILIIPSRRWGWLLVCLAVVLVNGARVAGLYVPAAHAAEPSALLTLATANLLSTNERYDDAIAYFRSTDADVVFVQEVTPIWLEKLKSGLPDYPYVVSEMRQDSFGIAVFSRIPLQDTTIMHFGGADLPAIRAAVEVSGKEVRFVNLHTMPPGNSFGLDLRNAQMDAAAAAVSNEGAIGFVAGDFNCAPWSPFFRDVLKKYGLQDGRRGFGVVATWPSFAAPFMIPIDECLTTPGVRVTSIERGPKIGSDHFPLRIELRISTG